MKHILKFVCIFTIMICVFLTLLVLTSMIPSEYIRENVIDSSELLSQEGNKRKINIPMKGLVQFDNYTDALMINTAYSIDSSTPLYSSLVARKNYIPNVTEQIYEDISGELKSASKYEEEYNPVGELKDTLNGEVKESFEYARYWHGYLCVLRPLLLVLNLKLIRILIMIILILLAVFFLKNIHKKLGIVYSILFLVGFIGVEYFYMGESIQGCFIFLITMIVMNILLRKNANIKNIPMCFFVIGMITNFFDFLTNPVITLGMPVMLIFLLKQKEKELGVKETIKIFVKTCIPWIIGYGLTWITKWVLVDVICGKELIRTSMSQVLFRTKGTGQFSVSFAWMINMMYILCQFVIEIIICVGIMVWGVIKNKKHLTHKEFLVKILPYIFIGIMPYIWYSILVDHSSKHSFFTYRNQILTLISLLICCYKFFDTNQLQEEKR